METSSLTTSTLSVLISLVRAHYTASGHTAKKTQSTTALFFVFIHYLALIRLFCYIRASLQCHCLAMDDLYH
jgi:hypothetical protein